MTTEAELVLPTGLVEPLARGAAVNLGRSDADDVVGLDTTDLGISARQLQVEWVEAAVVLQNLSGKRPLSVEYLGEVRHHRVPPGATHTFTGDALILVAGMTRTHPVGLRVPPDYARGIAGLGDDTVAGQVTMSERDRDALVALFAGYLRRWPRHDPEPLSYEEAADLLGADVTADTVRKRVERVRERINASGHAYIEGRNALWDLASHLIDNGTLHPSNLDRLGEQPNWRGPRP